MVEGVAAADVATFSGVGVVVFVHVSVLAPLLKQQFLGLLNQCLARHGQIVLADAEIDEEVHGCPDTAAHG